MCDLICTHIKHYCPFSVCVFCVLCVCVCLYVAYLNAEVLNGHNINEDRDPCA